MTGETLSQTCFSSIKLNFSLLMIENSWTPFHFFIDVPISNVGLILTQLKWFQLFSTVKIQFRTFLKRNSIFGFPWCSTREDLSIYVSITNVGLILTKLWWFIFSWYGQTDRQGFGILMWKHVGTQKIWTQRSKLEVSCRSLYASPDGGDA